jgi:hypothetical protein
MGNKSLGNIFKKNAKMTYVINLKSGEVLEMGDESSCVTQYQIDFFKKSRSHLVIQSEAPLTLQDLEARYQRWQAKNTGTKKCGCDAQNILDQMTSSEKPREGGSSLEESLKKRLRDLGIDCDVKVVVLD